MLPFVSDLDRAVRALVRGGITTNSRSTYQTAVRRYTSFCRIYSLPTLPVTQPNALRFVTHCAASGLAVSSIKVYLAGLRSWSIDMGLPVPEIYSPSMVQALRGLDRQHAPNQAPPLMYNHLLMFARLIPYNRDNLMALAAMSLAYFACLRPSEYLSTKGTARPPIRSDVTFAHDFSSFDFRVVSSKTKQRGFLVHVGCVNSPVCPVCMIRAIIARFPAPPSTPLFLTATNTPISYAHLSNTLHSFLSMAGVHPAPFTLHSLRSGSATTAAAVGFTEQQIQRLGRWTSDCYRRYIRPSRKEQAAAAPRLATIIN